MKSFLWSIVSILLLVPTLGYTASAQTMKDLPVAMTPPMGWNSWNHFRKEVTEAEVRAAADALVSSGMKDAGYVYVNVDGSWEGERDANGVLHVNPKKFTDMKKLADYVHSKGLKFGLYSSPGPKTCGGFEASYGHEEQDAQMFADWGVDFLKYDLCTFRHIMVKESGGDLVRERAIQMAAYEKMHQALVKTGRPIIYSLCQYGLDNVWEWGPQVRASMWRTTHDIQDVYFTMADNGFSQAGLAKYAGPGHWNDPDMLEVGNGGMKPEEYRQHFSLWAMEAAPLLAGNDLTKMDEDTKTILMNKEVIAIDQDPLGHAGDRVWAVGGLEFWARPLQGGAYAVALFNRQTGPARMTFHLKDLGLKGTWKAHDVWKHADVGTITGDYTVDVPRRGVVMLTLRK